MVNVPWKSHAEEEHTLSTRQSCSSRGTEALLGPVLLGKTLPFSFCGHWNKSHHARVLVGQTNTNKRTGLSRSEDHKRGDLGSQSDQKGQPLITCISQQPTKHDPCYTCVEPTQAKSWSQKARLNLQLDPNW